MRVWFTSDLHFGHKLMVYMRGFETADEMDQHIIKVWQAQVGAQDHVYVLGDYSFHSNPHTLKLTRQLPGLKHLVLGNHDTRLNGEVKAQFHWCKSDYMLKHEGTSIHLYHFPCVSWNKSHHGSWHLHGHCHGKLPEDPTRLRMDVGWDPHGRLLEYEEIKNMFAARV